MCIFFIFIVHSYFIYGILINLLNNWLLTSYIFMSCFKRFVVMHSQVPGWTHLKVHQSVVAERGTRKGAPDFQHYRGVEGHAKSPGIRLGRGTSRSSLNLHQNKPLTCLVHIPGHPWMLGQATGTLDHKTHHGLDSGEATTFPHIVFSTTLRWGYIQMALFPGTSKLESRNCPETVLVRVPGLWEFITPDCEVWSQRGLNQTCSPHRDLSNDVSHSWFGGQEEVDFWLLVVGSLPAPLLPITWATDVQMANARPFLISTLQDLSNDTKNTSMRGVLGLAVEP
jgi:hypothetical protein